MDHKAKAQWLASLPKGEKMAVEAAMRLAAQGYAFLPCTKAKAPPKGFALADKEGRPSQVSRDVEVIGRWADHFPYLAFLPAKCEPGLLVVDVDVKHFPAEPDQIKRLEGLVAELLDAAGGFHCRTMSGGWHIYFRAPEGPPLRNKKLYKARGTRYEHDCEWIETRTNSPAVAYKPVSFPEKPDQLKPVPAFLAEAIVPARRMKPAAGQVSWDGKTMKEASSDEMLERISTAPEGQRNDTLFLTAISFLRLHGDTEEAREALKDAGARALMEEEEIEATINSAADKAKEPTRHEARRLAVGLSLLAFVKASTEYDEEGQPIKIKTSDLVKDYWPQMRYFENLAVEALDKRGLWLEIREGRFHHLPKSRVEKRIRDMLKAVANGGYVPSKEMNENSAAVLRELCSECLAGSTEMIDQSDHLLDRTGLPICLKTGRPVAPDWKAPLRKRINVEYRPDAKSKHFVPALKQALGAGRTAEDAKKTTRFYQRLSGYMIKPRKTEKKLVMNVGVGHNGKTTFAEAEMFYLGREFAHIMDPDPLLQNFKGDPLTAFNSMIDKRMSFIEELPENRHLSTATLKRITGGRSMEIRKRFEDNKVVTSQSLIKINANLRPDFWDTSQGWLDRIIFIEWMMNFVLEGTADEGLGEKLEDDGPGWFNWALEGLREYNKIGLAIPDCIREGTRQYAEQHGDPLRTFYDRFLVADAGADPIPMKVLKEAYENWLQNTGEVDGEDHARKYAGSPQRFRKKVQNITGKVLKDPNGRQQKLMGYALADSELLGPPRGDLQVIDDPAKGKPVPWDEAEEAQ